MRKYHNRQVQVLRNSKFSSIFGGGYKSGAVAIMRDLHRAYPNTHGEL